MQLIEILLPLGLMLLERYLAQNQVMSGLRP